MNPPNELSNEKTETNKVESKDIFKNLKSDFFIQKVFYNLLKKKSLDIIKYNNNIKKRINISIKDYKEYSEIYSSIEIEIKFAKYKYGKFININKENKKHYQIYFNKEKIKRNYLKEKEDVEKLKIIIDYQIKSFKGLFENCKSIECIYFKKFCRNNVTNMRSMFDGCSSLKELNLSNFNTNNVTNMFGMFSKCSEQLKLKIKNQYKNLQKMAFDDDN